MSDPQANPPTSDGRFDHDGNIVDREDRTLDLADRQPRSLELLPAWLGISLLVVVLAILGVLLHRSRLLGHWWGDDWALYIRQANGLLDLNPGKVARENAFSVAESGGAPFSPPIYPWGYPAVLAVMIPVLGDGVDQLSIVGVVAALVFGMCWYRLALPRLGTVPALVGMVAVCFAPQITNWTDLIQSELVFMAAVGVFFVVLDPLARHGTLIAPSASWWGLFGLGLLAGFAFEVRREGLATLAAIGAAQLVQLIDQRASIRRWERPDKARWLARLFAPYVGFVLFVGTIKQLLPAVLVPRYPGSGIANVWRKWHKHVAHFADLIGIKSPSKPDPEILGSVGLGKAVLMMWGAVLVVALVLAATRWRRTEAHIAAYAVVAFVIGCSASAALSRYFATVVPLCSLLVLVVIAAGIRWILKRTTTRIRLRTGIATALIALVALPMAGYSMKVLVDRARNASISRDLGTYQWGAQHPYAVEMFTWVRENTTPDEVVGSFKARSMVLEARRQAVQVDDYRPLTGEIEVAVVVLETQSRVARKFTEDPEWTPVWSNQRLIAFAPRGSRLANEFGS